MKRRTKGNNTRFDELTCIPTLNLRISLVIIIKSL